MIIKDTEWLKAEVNKALRNKVADGINYYDYMDLGRALNELIDQLDKPEALSIDKEQLIKRIENYIPVHDKTVGDVVDGILEIVKRLPEMEVLSPEWIYEHEYVIMDPNNPFVYVDSLQNLLVPNQEELEVKIQGLIKAYKQEEDAYGELESGWIRGFIKDLKNLVEEEQKYTVSSPKEASGFWFLSKNKDGEVIIGTNKDYFDYGWDALKLTEQEIKDYDTRYFAFAVKVEEMD